MACWWHGARPAPSTRRSATPSPPSATTATSTRSGATPPVPAAGPRPGGRVQPRPPRSRRPAGRASPEASDSTSARRPRPSPPTAPRPASPSEIDGRPRQPGRRCRRRRTAPPRRLGRRDRPRVVDACRRGRPGRRGPPTAGWPAPPPARPQWVAGGRSVHHIVDPARATAPPPYWTLVSATGDSCVDANMVTTAAMVWGEPASTASPPSVSPFAWCAPTARCSLNGWPAEDSP